MTRPVVLGQPWDTQTAPPWDGTGVPFPVDSSGWPVLPDDGGGEPPAVNITLTIQVPDLEPGWYATLDGVADVQPVGAVEVWGSLNGAPATKYGDANDLGSQHFQYGYQIPADAPEGDVYVFEMRNGTSVSNQVTATIVAASEPEAIVSESAEGEPVELVAEALSEEEEAALEGQDIPTLSEGTPDETWTHAQIDAWASDPDHVVEYPRDANKADKIAAINDYLSKV